jgi:hypothetical protein
VKYGDLLPADGIVIQSHDLMVSRRYFSFCHEVKVYIFSSEELTTHTHYQCALKILYIDAIHVQMPAIFTV